MRVREASSSPVAGRLPRSRFKCATQSVRTKSCARSTTSRALACVLSGAVRSASKSARKSGGNVSLHGASDVSELAEAVKLPIPIASTYLRALNARGLVSVVRTGSYVLYGTASDRSLPVASAIQSAFFGLFAQRKLPRGWEKSLLPLLQGYAHPRREEIIRYLMRHAPLSFTEIQRASGVPPISLLRHLAILVPAGIVVKDEKRNYSLSAPDTDIAAALLNAVREDGGASRPTSSQRPSGNP